MWHNTRRVFFMIYGQSKRTCNYTYHAFGRAKPRERLRVDSIYVSDGIRVRDFVTHDDKRPGTVHYPSDHYPLSATIELPVDTSPATPVSRNP